jgi:hypothetical protein
MVPSIPWDKYNLATGFPTPVWIFGTTAGGKRLLDRHYTTPLERISKGPRGEEAGGEWRRLERGGGWSEEEVGARRRLERGGGWREEEVGERRRLERRGGWSEGPDEKVVGAWDRMKHESSRILRVG